MNQTEKEPSIPALRFKDQTPITPIRKEEKRPKIDVSPLESMLEGADFFL